MLRLLIQMPAHISWWLSWFPSGHWSGNYYRGRAKASLACLHFLPPLQQLTLSPAPFFDFVSDSPLITLLALNLSLSVTHTERQGSLKKSYTTKDKSLQTEGRMTPSVFSVEVHALLFDHFKCFLFILHHFTLLHSQINLKAKRLMKKDLHKKLHSDDMQK